MKRHAKKAAYLVSYPFLAAMGLALGYGFLLWEKRLLRERTKREQDKEYNTALWLAGVADDEPWPRR